jgi:hypothetical protein
VLAVVVSDSLVLDVKQVRQLTDLETISGSHQHRVSTLLKVLNDRFEERNMGRILQVDPDLFSPGTLVH